MLETQFDRTIGLIGQEKQEMLKTKKVLVLGVGGVGSYAVEMLARCGIGNIDIIDGDVVSITNINRQLIATNSTIGKDKVEVAKSRILDINPNVRVNAIKKFLTKDNVEMYVLNEYDYIIDAVDNVTVKIEVAKICDQKNINLISCMGTGNKLCPELFEITDIYKTSVCPLAKVMRKELKARGVKGLTVLYSREEPINLNKERVPASICFTPSIAGIRIAEYVIKQLLKAK